MFYSTIISRMILPFESAIFGFPIVMYIAGLLVVYVAVGVTESVTARYRMDKVPQFVLTSFALAFFATIITLEFVK